jgi:hypothetical protein
MSDRIYVGTRKGLFTIERRPGGARRWQIARSHFLGVQVPMLLHDARDNHVYAALGHGHFGSKLHRSRDGGQTFEEIAAPAYPEKPADYVDIPNPMTTKPIPWRLELIWSLEAGGPKQPGRLWSGTLPGGLFRSDDRGTNWQFVRSLWDHPGRREWFGGGAEYPGIHSICVDPRDADRVVLGVSCGGVWLTTDGGATWNCRATGMRAEYMPPERQRDPGIQDPHRVVQCAARPDCYWAQHHNGIFKTTNNCETWEELTAVPVSAFGFGVVVHPKDSNTAWFVPAVKDELRYPVDGKVVVNRTRDGGRTFETLRDGLPQEHAYDLVFRHALDIDAGGQRLVFGSTTGSLWVSENQGDSWECVSTHLPPIYCTRFAADSQ